MWSVDFSRVPQHGAKNGELAGDRHNGAFLGVLAAFRLAQPPAAEVAVRAVLAQHVMGAVHEQLPEVDVAGFGDDELRGALAARPLARYQTRLGADLAAGPE